MILRETIWKVEFLPDENTTTTARMVTAKGETGGGELFQFAEQFPILVELWTLDARVSRNTERPATLVVRIMQIKLVHSVCSSAWKLLDKCQTASVLPCSRRDMESLLWGYLFPY